MQMTKMIWTNGEIEPSTTVHAVPTP